jgi:hypothetical protein
MRKKPRQARFEPPEWATEWQRNCHSSNLDLVLVLEKPGKIKSEDDDKKVIQQEDRLYNFFNPA